MGRGGDQVSLPERLTWHVHPDGLHIWRDGEFVGKIGAGSFGRLIYAMAKVMRG